MFNDLCWNLTYYSRLALCIYKTLNIVYNKKTTRVPVLSHQTTRVKTYHLSAKREGDEFYTECGLVNENRNSGGFLFIMNLKI